YFALIAGAVINFIYSISYLTGSIYEAKSNGQVTAEQVYAYYGGALQAADIACGIFLIAFAVAALVLRSKLAKYKPDAPKFVKIFYSIVAAVPFIYTLVVAAITSQALTAYAVSAISSLVAGIVFLVLNIIYFNKRAHLFVDKTAIAVNAAQTLASTINISPSSPAAKTTTNVELSPGCSNAQDTPSVTETAFNAIDLQEVFFCRKCGAKLVDDSTFCHKCGTKIF
ncbi:MAG: zinc-ribbon domain-containing protein, partial [Oscillospiraceae bacterium]|nr:zinc-ribbon domain-containing protein [Oscillospiraceae bacterium]